MPFPLAHPAAVLPLRRHCGRYLSFPALVIGSLSPDVGYCFGRLHMDVFSHRFLAGGFGFCLPMGLLMYLVFHLVRSPVVGILPARYRPAILPLHERSVGSPVVIIISLLIGAWTHICLDSISHPDTWLVEHLPMFQGQVASVGNYRFRLHDVLYAGCTFVGVAWLALSYLRWLERTLGAPGLTSPGLKWGSALVLASSILSVALASRGVNRWLGIFPLGIITVLLVIGFLVVTRRPFTKARS
jgi:hypothetical protein